MNIVNFFNPPPTKLFPVITPERRYYLNICGLTCYAYIIAVNCDYIFNRYLFMVTFDVKRDISVQHKYLY